MTEIHPPTPGASPFVRREYAVPDDPFAAGLLSTRQMALLLGVSEQELRTEYERQHLANPDSDGFTIPKQWIRQGNEISARLGVDSVESALRILEAEAAQ